MFGVFNGRMPVRRVIKHPDKHNWPACGDRASRGTGARSRVQVQVAPPTYPSAVLTFSVHSRRELCFFSQHTAHASAHPTPITMTQGLSEGPLLELVVKDMHMRPNYAVTFIHSNCSPTLTLTHT